MRESTSTNYKNCEHLDSGWCLVCVANHDRELRVENSALRELAGYPREDDDGLDPKRIISLQVENQRLRELVPEMLSACQEAVKLLEDPGSYGKDCQPCYGMLRGAISTAKRRLEEIEQGERNAD